MLYKKIAILTLSLLCLTSCNKNNFKNITETETVKTSNTLESNYEISEADTAVNLESDTTSTESDEKWDVAYSRPKAIDKITDEIIRTDYAEYVSERDGIEISADNVYGVFNFGTENRYKILVMCTSETHTDDIKTLHLQCMPHPEDNCDCYPYIDIELPSGSYEAFAYRHGRFHPLEEAISDTLVSYNISDIIYNYMVEYYEGATECVYAIE